jgi:hypothetical protein
MAFNNTAKEERRLTVGFEVHIGGYREFCLLGYDTMWPCCLYVISCLAESLALKIEMVCYSEILVDVLWTRQCYILEDRTLHRLTVFKYRVLMCSEFHHECIILICHCHSQVLELKYLQRTYYLSLC